MSLSIPLSLRVGAKSHAGMVRSENQDRMSRFTSPLGEVFIVADGMGGHQGGLTAVVMTIDGFDTFLGNAVPQSSIPDALRNAAQKTNERVYRLANSNDPSTAKMGSTVVLTLIDADQVWIGHVGDSRAYLYRSGEVTRLTKDHSMVQKMVDHDMLTEEQARNHPDASVITRAFGQLPELELEVSGPLELLPGDGVLLCTDGLSGYVGDEQIAETIQRYSGAQEVSAALIDLALAAGGEDNVTVQYILFASTEEQIRVAAKGKKRRTTPATVDKASVGRGDRYSFSISVMLLAAAVVFGVLLGWFLGRGSWQRGTIWRNEKTQPLSSPSPSPNQPENKATATPEVSKEPESQNEPTGTEAGSDPPAIGASPN